MNPTHSHARSLSLSLILSHTHTQAKDKVLVGREEAERLKVMMEDFEHALQYDLKPAFGISDEQLDRYVFNGKWPERHNLHVVWPGENDRFSL